jgi:hypothetical protein
MTRQPAKTTFASLDEALRLLLPKEVPDDPRLSDASAAENWPEVLDLTHGVLDPVRTALARVAAG